MATHYATVLLDTVASTQDEARQQAVATGQPTLVVAQRQVEGRGRSGRVWLEAPRAMYSSLAFRPEWAQEVRARLTLIAGLAVRRALADLTPTQPGLKWPNDLVTATGKLGGILTEAEGEWVVVGCGVNLWWPEAPPGIAAACQEDPGPELATEIGRVWASATLEAAAADPAEWDVAAYREACVTLGTEIVWAPEGRGVAVDVAASGGLVIETATGTLTLTSGEINNVRPAD